MSTYELALGDCFDYLATLSDASVDMVCVDLPYGTTQLVWDKTIDLEQMWREVYRVSKPSAVQVMFGSQPFTTDLMVGNRKRFRYDWTWSKKHPTGFLNAKKMPLRVHEDVLIFSAASIGNFAYNPQMRKGQLRTKGGGSTLGDKGVYNTHTKPSFFNDDYYPTSIVEVYRGQQSEKIHPTQKPLELLCYLVKTYSNPGDTVLDFCAGSGTTHAACLLTGRNALGCEISAEYHKAATHRLEAISAQGALQFA